MKCYTYMHSLIKSQDGDEHHKWDLQCVLFETQAAEKPWNPFNFVSDQTTKLLVKEQCHQNLQETYGVILASPVGQRTPGWTSGISKHAAWSPGPAALCIAETWIWRIIKAHKLIITTTVKISTITSIYTAPSL